jgi:uncharacterized protein (TIGR02246 family)
MDANADRIRDTARRWVAAVAEADIATLRTLMTDDIVIIHGDGRVLEGIDAVTADLVRGVADVRIDQRVEPEETVVAGAWAFERASVRTTVTPRSGGESNQWDSRTLTVLHQDASGPWRIARDRRDKTGGR